VAELIASEFFEQGDIEKHELNMKPLDMMDRERASELPRMQLSFIDVVCMPVYKVRCVHSSVEKSSWIDVAEGRAG